MSQINEKQLKQLIEASLFVLAKPMTIKALKETVLSQLTVSRDTIQAAIEQLQADYEGRGVQLVKVAGGYRFQTLTELSPLLQPLWQEKPPKYSRATLETIAVIAYRQPVTRGDIERVRGVAVSSHIIKTLQDRNWIKAVGHKEVPGRPTLYATTTDFLGYFGLESITALPLLTDRESLEGLFSNEKIAPEHLESIEESTNE
ncbi:SMC-Scp complex subunit ScpB [Shewanella surugensis]|uniref:SMC-Scp complex subunit ScpB n=1 Tax=Shewanella surugensis TaxID=212020 RepID=A0ABT0LH07_9GAMM|nr:SMC-Scp complex subunit ScpB [Shewanella surugensis]MCL1126950.1 SMC-Scp complex subunit ScpB [Shewanella surugensis]